MIKELIAERFEGIGIWWESFISRMSSLWGGLSPGLTYFIIITTSIFIAVLFSTMIKELMEILNKKGIKYILKNPKEFLHEVLKIFRTFIISFICVFLFLFILLILILITFWFIGEIISHL